MGEIVVMSLEDLIGTIETYSEDVQLVILEAFEYFYCRNSSDPISLKWNKAFTPIVTNVFLMVDEEYYHLYHIRDLIENLDSINFPYPQTLKRNKDGRVSIRAKQEWCRNNRDIVITYYPKAEYVLYARIHPTDHAFQYVQDIYEYLGRKFIDVKQIHIVNGNKYEFTSPKSSMVTDYQKFEFKFPKDKITKLLDYYSANRCNSKKAGVIIEDSYFPVYRCVVDLRKE